MTTKVFVFLIFVGCCLSSAKADAWRFTHVDSTAMAMTTNADGNLFGVMCKKTMCYYVLTLDQECEEDTDYPVLANSDAGTNSFHVSCWTKLDDGYALTFNSYDAVDSLARQANSVSFAIPISNNKFRVEKFDLRGNIEVIDKMLAWVVKRYKKATTGYEM